MGSQICIFHRCALREHSFLPALLYPNRSTYQPSFIISRSIVFPRSPCSNNLAVHFRFETSKRCDFGDSVFKRRFPKPRKMMHRSAASCGPKRPDTLKPTAAPRTELRRNVKGSYDGGSQTALRHLGWNQELMKNRKHRTAYSEGPLPNYMKGAACLRGSKHMRDLCHCCA